MVFGKITVLRYRGNPAVRDPWAWRSGGRALSSAAVLGDEACGRMRVREGMEIEGARPDEGNAGECETL
jgi:hypothetical protein